jgi:tRNA-binding EMAP/Myf-like protein
MNAFCKNCDSVQEVEEGSAPNLVYCVACGDEFEHQPTETGNSKFSNYKIGKVLKVDPVAKSKDLKVCRIDVNGDGKEETSLQIVTNAKYCEVGWKVVVACIGAVVPAGAVVGEDDEAIKVTKRAVQGVESQGMICDCDMLGWAGGAKGFIQQLPDSFNVGDSIPETRPAKLK